MIAYNNRFYALSKMQVSHFLQVFQIYFNQEKNETKVYAYFNELQDKKKLISESGFVRLYTDLTPTCLGQRMRRIE